MKSGYTLIVLVILMLAQNVSAQQTRQEAPTVFKYVQNMPKAGYDWNKYLSKNLHYPDSALKNGIEGRVIVSFIVNEDGSISDAVVARGIGGGCDQEAVRLIKAAPAWKPGEENGVPVKVYFMSPVIFKLPDSDIK